MRAIPTTTNRLYSVQATGSNAGTWGAGTSDSLNEGVMQIMDANMGGITALSLTNVNVNLTQTQANNGMLRMTGALTGNVVIAPAGGVTMSGFFYFENLTTNSFSVTFSNAGGSVVLPQGRRGTMWIDTTYGPRVISSVGSTQTDVVPAGSVITFYNSAAPTGYTLVALSDYALQVVGSGGGVTSGSVPYSTLFGLTSVGATALTEAQLPSHSHALQGFSVPTFDGFYTVYGGGLQVAASIGYISATSNTGSGATHTHTLDMRVRTAKVILATRN